jgi:hypothetical protein
MQTDEEFPQVMRDLLKRRQDTAIAGARRGDSFSAISAGRQSFTSSVRQYRK